MAWGLMEWNFHCPNIFWESGQGQIDGYYNHMGLHTQVQYRFTCYTVLDELWVWIYEPHIVVAVSD